MQKSEVGENSCKDDDPTASYEDRLVAALDDAAQQGKLEVLSFLADQLHGEQSHYWSRFAALAALHAGLLVVAVETSGWARGLTSLLGIGLALVWLAIQERSREYVERWKPAFHSYRRKQRLRWKSERQDISSPEQIESRKWSSTKLAMLVPWALLVPWVILLVLALIDARPNTAPQTDERRATIEAD